MKKNLTIAFLSALMALGFTLTACGGGEQEGAKKADSTATDSSAAKQEEPKKEEPAAVSYWEGEATTDVEKLAKDACDCMTSVMTEAGVNIEVMLTGDAEAKKAEAAKVKGVKMADVPCAKDIDARKEAMNVDSKALREAGKKCKLMGM